MNRLTRAQQDTLKNICTNTALWCFNDLVGWIEAMWITYENARFETLPIPRGEAEKLTNILEATTQRSVGSLGYGRYQVIDTFVGFSVIHASFEELLYNFPDSSDDPVGDVISRNVKMPSNDFTDYDSWSIDHEIMMQGLHWLRIYFQAGVNSNQVIRPAVVESPSYDGRYITEVTGLYFLYENWQDREVIDEDELSDFKVRRDQSNYDIWILEPNAEYYHFSKKLQKVPDARLQRLLKAILNSGHIDQPPLDHLHKAMWQVEESAKGQQVMDKARNLTNAFSECRKLFGGVPLVKIRRDGAFPRFEVKKDFSYCLIEPKLADEDS